MDHHDVCQGGREGGVCVCVCIWEGGQQCEGGYEQVQLGRVYQGYQLAACFQVSGFTVEGPGEVLHQHHDPMLHSVSLTYNVVSIITYCRPQGTLLS